MGSPIATGAIKTTATNTVGAGLRLKPRINKKILGLSEEQGSELEEQISNEFNMWANSKVDVLGLLDFYALQELAFLSVLLSGEVFVLLPFIETQDNNPYGLKIQLVEADRICNERNKKNTDEMIEMARSVLWKATRVHARLLLPSDVVVTNIERTTKPIIFDLKKAVRLSSNFKTFCPYIS